MQALKGLSASSGAAIMARSNIPPAGLSPQAVGAAGVQFVAAELLKQGLLPAFPLLDNGYDLLSDHAGRINRLQIKTRLADNSTLVNEKSCRFPILRRKAGISTSAGYHARPTARYSADQFDAMVFVDFVYNRTFVLPAALIDFRKTSLTLRSDSPWLNAWWVLKNDAQRQITQLQNP